MGNLSTGLAGRYAAALFDLAEQEGIVETIDGDLFALHKVLESSQDFVHLVRSPTIPRRIQEKGITAIATKMETHKLTRNFLGVLARNRRLSVLMNIVAAWRVILADKRGEVSADVVSASTLSHEQVESLQTALKKGLGAKNVTVNTAQDPALLGGMVVQVGSRMIDNSLRTKLARLRLAMKGVG